MPALLKSEPTDQKVQVQVAGQEVCSPPFSFFSEVGGCITFVGVGKGCGDEGSKLMFTELSYVLRLYWVSSTPLCHFLTSAQSSSCN